MSTTTTTSLAPLSSSCTGVFNTPNQDNVCAMIYKDNATDIMSKCCGDAQLVAYQNDCGVYCVAIDQTIVELGDCLFANGAPDANVFCSGNKTTTKTEDAKVPASAQASVIDGDDDDDKDDDETASATGTSTKTSSSSSASETSSETGNAAAGVAPKSTFNTVGLAIGALLFSSIAAGAFQL
ncbi:hypothetical protein BKA59DRAFT_475107 [Fusarium tricinctum]|jgi:hypothetical protein|uniref:Uncharacterized protein n=2 Tax=Fusarium tricinctum species complex TaxID=679429 RepID=A0A8K0S6C9_9HYPO|nr:hypothetical protein BKA59DRAFT_475107 [Fusarium tricinctum]